MKYTDNTPCTRGAVCASAENTEFSLLNYLCNGSTSDIGMNHHIVN